MRCILRVSAVVAVLLGSMALAPSVALAIPVLSGTYVFSASSNCQATLSVTKDVDGKVTGVNIDSGGAVNGIAGTATFTPDVGTPQAGQAALKISNVDGPALIMQGVDTQALKLTNSTENWAYSNTGTAVTLNGVVYRAAYGKLASNVAQHFTVVGREEGNRCVFYGTFTRK
jgi:hypothetical protein